MGLTEQGKREKVIKGLECHFLVDMEPCEKCSYYMRKDCTGDLAKDALELLEAQEAQVMTLEEAQKAEYVYLETRKWVDGDYHGTAKHKDTEFSDCLTEFVDGYGCVLSCDNAMYGDNWRCWTNQPTPEQAEATPWN